ncbi:MAG: nitroimidazol reductase NimA-like FMN-containing flavoprotein [Desulforhopalus sp.]|jgi:nitroimidazol reductase NimA-like FMN-containing flavoprotein (pyridoxamine 5'-phosphate oxidase superfamily)
MSETEKDIQKEISSLLSSQKLAVLSTQRDGQPYSSLMAFAYSSDLKDIVVATAISTRKHQNLVQESRVSLLIDNRSNSENDFHGAAALTVLGKAEQINDTERRGYEELYLKRHPYLEKFLGSSSTAFFKVMVHHYLLVSDFQKVKEYRVRDEADVFT